jgi:MoaA/NifB/PqqE/SkfB family radical SAM enzyme/GT2 family glycosyltransferase
MKISIIIPTCNRPEDLDACLRSIETQQGGNVLQTVVVDDAGSADLAHLLPRIDVYIRSPVNLGPSYSRNVAALQSDGDVLLFLDDDTELLSDSVREVARIIENNPDIGAIGGCGPADASGRDVEFISGKVCGEFRHEKFVYFPPGDEEDELRIVGPNKRDKYFCYPSKKEGHTALYDCDHVESAFLAVPRSVFEEVGGYDPYWFYMCEDRDLCLEIKSRGYRVVTAWAPRAIHHNHTSYQASDDDGRRMERNQRVMEVIVKREGAGAALKWMSGHAAHALDRKHLPGLLEVLRSAPLLKKRRGVNYLDRTELDRYLVSTTAENLASVHPFPVERTLRTPTNLVLFINNRCNMACDHCFIPDLNTRTPEMSTEQVKRIVDSLDQPVDLTLTGGEALLTKDLEEIMDHMMANRYVRYLGLLTNGSMPRRLSAICETLLARYPDKKLKIQISLDGTEELHDDIRKMRRGYEKAMKSFEHLAELRKKYRKLKYTAAITLMRENLDAVESLIDELERIGVPSKMSMVRGNSFSTFDVPASIFKAEYEPQKPYLGNDLDAVNRFLDRVEARHPDYFKGYQRSKLDIMLETLKTRKRSFPCRAGFDDAVIYSDGFVAVCEQVVPFGHLEDWDWDLAKAWNSTPSWEHRALTSRCACINGCNISTHLDLLGEAPVARAAS